MAPSLGVGRGCRLLLLPLLLSVGAAEHRGADAGNLRHFALSADEGLTSRTSGADAAATGSLNATAAVHVLEVASQATPSVVVMPGTHHEAASLRSSWWRVYALGGLIMCAMTPILHRQGVGPFMIALLYVASLTLVKFFVKVVISRGLAYPYSITASHMLLTGMVCSLLDPPQRHEAIRVLPVALANGLALALDNSALVFGGVAFVAMIGCCTPASTCALEVVLGRRGIATWGTVAVIVVCSGGMLCVNGERHFSDTAFLLAGLATVFRSFKCVWQHELLLQIPLLRVVAWSSIWCLCTLTPVALKVEGLEFVYRLRAADAHTQGAAALSAITAAILNVAQCCALREMGPLVQTVTGNLQLIMVVALACAWLNEAVTTWQWVGVVMLAAGATLVKASPKEKGPLASPLPGLSAAEGRLDGTPGWLAALGLASAAADPPSKGEAAGDGQRQRAYST